MLFLYLEVTVNDRQFVFVAWAFIGAFVGVVAFGVVDLIRFLV